MKTVWKIDGVNLNPESGEWQVSGETPPPTPASQKVSELRLLNRSGVVSRRLGWGEGSQRIVLDVLDGPVSTVESRAAALRTLLARARVLTRKEPGQPEMHVDVVKALVSEPVRLGPKFWRVEAVFSLAPFWRESSTVTSGGLLPSSSVVFDGWAGSTGDVVDAVVRLKGPFTRATVAQGGRDARFDVARSASQFLFFEPQSFRAWTGGASAWSPGSNRVLVEYGAGGPLTALTPGAGGVEVSVSGEGFVTSGDAAGRTQVSLRGGRYWL